MPDSEIETPVMTAATETSGLVFVAPEEREPWTLERGQSLSATVIEPDDEGPDVFSHSTSL